MKIDYNKYVWALSILFSFCFAVQVCYVSVTLSPRFQHRQETIDHQLSLLAGQSWLQDGKETYNGAFQNRVLFPLILKGASCWKILRISQWYLILRFLSAFAMFLTVWLVLNRFVSSPRRLIIIAQGLLCYETIFSFDHGWEHTSDFFDVIFIALFIAAGWSKSRFVMLALVVGSSFNRESSLFGGIIWLCLYGVKTFDIGSRVKINWKEAGYGVLLSIVALISVQLIRFAFAGKMVTTSNEFVLTRSFENLLSELPKLNPTSWPILGVAMFLPVIIWLGSNWVRCDARGRGLILSGMLIFLITLVFGLVNELRVFLPTITILTVAAVHLENCSSFPPFQDGVSPSKTSNPIQSA